MLISKKNVLQNQLIAMQENQQENDGFCRGLNSFNQKFQEHQWLISSFEGHSINTFPDKQKIDHDSTQP